jgi:hypothetical protein
MGYLLEWVVAPQPLDCTAVGDRVCWGDSELRDQGDERRAQAAVGEDIVEEGEKERESFEGG